MSHHVHLSIRNIFPYYDRCPNVLSFHEEKACDNHHESGRDHEDGEYGERSAQLLRYLLTVRDDDEPEHECDQCKDDQLHRL